jgi:hypothetical protein
VQLPVLSYGPEFLQKIHACVNPQVGKVTLKNNGDEALSDESLKM